jgi:signal transduction histidine kinase/ActR/RegA family two-component response regulator
MKLALERLVPLAFSLALVLVIVLNGISYQTTAQLNAALAQNTLALPANVHFTQMTILFGTLAGSLALGIANLVILRQIRHRRTAEKALQGFNAQLEERVSIRTQELEQTAQEQRAEMERRQRAETELEALLAREKAARQEAEEANRLKDEFVATVSHELRTPLNAILGWARMLRIGGLDQERTAKAVETIERSAENQAHLVEDLLDMSRLLSGKLRLDIHTLDPATIINTAIETIRPAAVARSIALHVQLDPAVSQISGDPNRLQQIIWNLLSNAIRFTPVGGTVNLQLSQDETQIIISVSDTGQGISPEFLPHVFEHFRQADSSIIRRHGGLGLGLAIVRHLVELHGGSVTADSAGADTGATFTVRLPIAPAQVAPTSMTDSVKAVGWPPLDGVTPILQGLSILVVDDEEDARQLIQHVLTSYGANVITACSASEALDAISRQLPNLPDLIVSDIGMPGEDGYSLIRKIRHLQLGTSENLPAVALTAYARSQDRMRAIAAGFQHHVPKPVEPAELATVIASLTGRISSHAAQGASAN